MNMPSCRKFLSKIGGCRLPHVHTGFTRTFFDTPRFISLKNRSSNQDRSCDHFFFRSALFSSVFMYSMASVSLRLLLPGVKSSMLIQPL